MTTDVWKLSADTYADALTLAFEGLKYDDAARRMETLRAIQRMLEGLERKIAEMRAGKAHA